MRRMLCLLAALVLLLACPALAEVPLAGQPQPAQAPAAQASGLLHYLVLGRDAYDTSGFAYSRTDTVLVVSLDPQGGRVILTSILRDCMVDTPRGTQNKINSIFRNYGFEGVKSTVEEHLGIQIEGTVVFDFEAVKLLIDALGGVDIEIDVNEYTMIKSILLGSDPNMPKGAGMTHMTGRIALAYMRDRSSGNGDFSRAERQRKVLGELLDKCRGLSIPELLEVYNSVRDMEGLETDLEAEQLLGAFSAAFSLMEAEIVSYHVPQKGAYSYGTLRGSSILDVNWKKTREKFAGLLYGEE